MTKEKAIQHIKRALEVPNRIGLALVDDEALNFVVEELSKDAQPKKTGRNLSIDYPSQFTCSECGYDNYDTYCGNIVVFSYCPHCGARMEE